MRNKYIIFVPTAVLLLSACSPSMMALNYPPTKIDDVSETRFGIKVRDPYRWLEDAHSAEVQKWMNAEADLTRKYLDGLPKRDTLAKRVTELTYHDSFSAPKKRGNKIFYSKRLKNQEKGILFSKDLDGKNEKPLLDLEKELDKADSLGSYAASLDGTKLAYVIRKNNSDEETVRVRDLATGKDFDTVSGLKYDGVSWNSDSSGFFYQYFGNDKDTPPTERISRATTRFHRLKDDSKLDNVVFTSTQDPQVFPYVRTSWDGRWVFVFQSRSGRYMTIYAKNLSDPAAQFIKIFDAPARAADVKAYEGYFYILTNLNAPNFKIIRISIKDIRKQEIIVPEQRRKILQDFAIVGGRLVVKSIKNVSNILEVRTLRGKSAYVMPLPKIGTIDIITESPDDKIFYIGFNSFLQPDEIFKADVESKKLELWEPTNLPFEASAFKVKQVWYKSKDGTRVPMFIVDRKDASHKGSTPFILYGYGGYGASLLPAFSPTIATWLEHGGGYALANIRGGGGLGEEWHRGGVKEKKQNVFDDFISAAEFLEKNKYTNSSKLAIWGGSNGGLLVGAVMVQRPDLMKAVVCEVPTLDMLRYHLFGDGKFWITELGNPEVEREFKTLYAYSPYHQLKPRTSYPAVFLDSYQNDDRVDPMHARKFVAAVQAVNSTGNPILLRIEQKAGHGGGASISSWVQNQVDKISFLLSELSEGS